MSKILILQESLMPYRVPIYKRIMKEHDLTVGYFYLNNATRTDGLLTLHLKHYTIGGFTFSPGLKQLCSQYDIVITIPNLKIFDFCFLIFRKRCYKVITWSIGVRSSYKRHYTLTPKHNIPFFLSKLIFRKADANIFYTNRPIDLWAKQGIDRHKLFVANNTVEIYEGRPQEQDVNKKDSILFIGSLYKQKRIDELIDSYLLVANKMQDFFILNIIGGGDELESLTQKYQYPNIHFLGPIFDEKQLSHFFSQAILCVSPGQAGLSVLKSMGYGVPFVTNKNAITGGEIFNIENNVNGFLYSTNQELIGIFEDLAFNPAKYLEAGRKAREYYTKFATPEIMTKGVLDAIRYVLVKND